MSAFWTKSKEYDEQMKRDPNYNEWKNYPQNKVCRIEQFEKQRIFHK